MNAPVTAKSRRWKRLRLIGAGLLAFIFLALNGIAYTHAWAITHYAPVDTRTTRLHEIHTWTDKARLIVLGPTIRRILDATRACTEA